MTKAVFEEIEQGTESSLTPPKVSTFSFYEFVRQLLLKSKQADEIILSLMREGADPLQIVKAYLCIKNPAKASEYFKFVPKEQIYPLALQILFDFDKKSAEEAIDSLRQFGADSVQLLKAFLYSKNRDKVKEYVKYVSQDDVYGATLQIHKEFIEEDTEAILLLFQSGANSFKMASAVHEIIIFYREKIEQISNENKQTSHFLFYKNKLEKYESLYNENLKKNDSSENETLGASELKQKSQFPPESPLKNATEENSQLQIPPAINFTPFQLAQFFLDRLSNHEAELAINCLLAAGAEPHDLLRAYIAAGKHDEVKTFAAKHKIFIGLIAAYYSIEIMNVYKKANYNESDVSYIRYKEKQKEYEALSKQIIPELFTIEKKPLSNGELATKFLLDLAWEILKIIRAVEMTQKEEDEMLDKINNAAEKACFATICLAAPILYISFCGFIGGLLGVIVACVSIASAIALALLAVGVKKATDYIISQGFWQPEKSCVKEPGIKLVEANHQEITHPSTMLACS